MLQSAGVHAVWGTVPTAEDIRKLDQDRLLQSPLLAEELTEDDLEMAKALLAERSPEDIAAALVRLYRSHLPAAEEVFAPGPDEAAVREQRQDREPREPRGPRNNSLPGRSLWFRLNIGRQKNADPRWLIPMICRQGKITKAEIGAIRIFERETRFEIDEQVAERFVAALAQIERADVRIEALGDAPPAEGAPHGPKRDKSPANRPVKEHWKGKPGGGDKPRTKPKKRDAAAG